MTLVGVIDADTAMHIPDFIAAERTFQLITQVAGRAGRSDMGGEVIVQTFYPGHYALRAASRHDYEGFYKHEIGLRDALGYPPRKKLINCTFRGTQEHLVKSECERFNALLVGSAIPALEILGPSPALRPLLHRKHRWQIILKSDGDIDKHIIGLFKDFHPKKDVQASLEVEPVSLM